MRYDTRYSNRSSFSLPGFPNGVKWLIIANVAIYVLDFFLSLTLKEPALRFLYLHPRAVISHFAIWQLVTYMFLHSLGSPWHLIFNMLALWMFGAPVEQTWGTQRFLKYYMVCGVGGGITQVAANMLFGNPDQLVLGASGAVYGLLLAFGMLFPNQEVLFALIFPIKAKYLVLIFGAIAFFGSFSGDSAVSNLAHLGGMLFGFLYIRSAFASRRPSGARLGGSGGGFNLPEMWRKYKIQRNKKKFQVYMRKHGSGPPDWKN
jgi:membrane associated rhomboid family serine protease